MNKKKIYLDYAATTPVSLEVVSAMTPYFTEKYGNASEIHDFGVEAKIAIEEARNQIASLLNASREEIIFTSCATESINLAHKGLIEGIRSQWSGDSLPHIITTKIEHKAVLATCEHLEKLGQAEVTYLPVNKEGLIDLEDLKKAIKENTVLVSIMFVNNEVGSVEPIAEVGNLIKEINQKQSGIRQTPIYFHTDATQAIQYFDCDVNKLNVDLLSFTGHKFYAPKGIGVLYLRKGLKIARQQDGGGQETGRRSGTENVPYIVGLGEAIRQVISNKEEAIGEVEKLRDRLIEGALKIEGVELTGPRKNRAPHIASFIISGVEGEAMQLMLNEEGIAASTGSACTTGDLAPSHVLSAMGYMPQEAHGSLRLSLGKDTTIEDIDYALEVLPKVLEKLRKIAPQLNVCY